MSEEFGNVQLGHVARMWKRNAYWVLFEDLKERLLGRSTGRAEDFKIYLNGILLRAHRIHAAQDGVMWPAVVSIVPALHVP